MRYSKLLFCAIPLMASSVYAIDTDRPEATESSSIVGPGVVQLESGIRYSERDAAAGNVDRLSLVDSVARYGLSETVELRLDWDGFISQELSGQRTDNGISDVALGAKVFLHSETRQFGETALLGQLNLPVGDEEFSSDSVDPSVILAMSHSLVNDFRLGYSVGVGFDTVKNKRGKENTDSSLLFGIQLERTYTDRVGGYVEIAGARGLSADADPVALGLGSHYLLLDNLQLDTQIGLGLSNDAEDFFVGVGLAYLP